MVTFWFCSRGSTIRADMSCFLRRNAAATILPWFVNLLLQENDYFEGNDLYWV